MKIAVVAPSQVPSSTANSIQVMKVCQAFAQLGHQVCLWLPGNASTPWQTLAEYYGLSTSFEIRWLPSSLAIKRYDLAWKAICQAKNWKADLVYTWMLQSAALALHSGVPLILEMHMPPSGRLGPFLFKHLAQHPGKKRILFITEALHRQLQAAYTLRLASDDWQIAPMGSEPERYDELPASAEDVRSRLGLPEGFTAAYAGHFYPGRGAELLFDLAKAMPNIRFLWVGGRPSDLDVWNKKLSSAGIANVSLTGFIQNQRLPSYLAASDVLLMPYGTQVGVSSRGNTADVCSPMKMFDYLSAGKPIITSDLPVLHEVLNESNAVFCPPGDFHAWRQAIETLAGDEVRCQRMAAQAKTDAWKYTWKARAERSIAHFL